MDTFSKNWTAKYMADEPKVCETCIEALEEDGCPEGAEAHMAVEMGADIADHLCDEVEGDSDIHCACACHPQQRKARWEGTKKDLTPEVIADVYRQSHG